MSENFQLCSIMSGGRKQGTKAMTNVVTQRWKYCGIIAFVQIEMLPDTKILVKDCALQVF